MLELLASAAVWNEYFEYKRSRSLMNPLEEEFIRRYIDEERYLPIATGLCNGTYSFGIPQRRELNKLGTAKKRVVYTFSEDENMILRLLSYLLYAYDEKLSPNCYAFRRETGARRAFTDMAYLPGISSLWCFKADISNYFNSITIEILTPILERIIDDDKPLLDFLVALLNDDRCESNGEIIHEQKGVMAGTPVSPFLANIYLTEADRYFAEKGVKYARYSDDIIIFDNEEHIKEHIDTYRTFLEKYRLKSNSKKELLTAPGEAWTFLGFEYKNGVIDIAPVTVEKLTGKIRRSSRSIRRWMVKKNAQPERTLKAFNKKMNRKFYNDSLGHELSWARWFFPLINTTESLHRIDLYMQDCQRYIVTGKHNKSSMGKVPYEMLKECGYKPLVSSFYNGQKDNAE